MTTWLGRAAFAAMIAFGAGQAGAQITTVVTPPQKPAAVQREIAQRREAAQDSIARVTLTGMKEWVDSAAATLALRPDTGRSPASDTARATVSAATPTARDSTETAASAGRQPTEFREGVRAPDTATSIPTLALGGLAMIMIGIAVRRRRLGEVRANASH